MKNIYVYNDKIELGKDIIDTDGTYHAETVIELTDEQVSEIKAKMVFRDGRSRCMVVYRDGLIIDGNIYNICFSCGDVKINGENKLINNDLKDHLRNLLTYGG